MSEIEIAAEITGSVWKVLVAEGQAVAEDDTLMVFESMKMEIPLTAPEDGTIRTVNVHEGDSITEGDVVCVITVF